MTEIPWSAAADLARPESARTERYDAGCPRGLTPRAPSFTRNDPSSCQYCPMISHQSPDRFATGLVHYWTSKIRRSQKYRTLSVRGFQAHSKYTARSFDEGAPISARPHGIGKQHRATHTQRHTVFGTSQYTTCGHKTLLKRTPLAENDKNSDV